MKYPKEIFVKDYFEIHEYYSNIYGNNRTIILMQVGSFHECYCTNNKGLDLLKLAAELDVSSPLKNGKKPISSSNPRMLGFPIYVVHNFIEKLCNLNFTVVLINQVTSPPKPKREVVGIYSPATYIENNKLYSESKPTYLTSIIIDYNKKNNQPLFVVGISTYDLTTGHGNFFECYSQPNDTMLALDETLRFLESFPSREVIFHFNKKLENKINNLGREDIISYLNLKKDNIFELPEFKKLKKISYQKDLIERIFPSENQIDTIDYLGLSFYNWSRLALTMLLQYTKDHQKILLKKLRPPVIYNNNDVLFLGNRALDQLDVLPSPIKPTSLFQVINFTRSSLGKRYLRDCLSRPLINKEKIKVRSDIIELIINKKLGDELGDMLSDIYDLERLNRRLEIENMHPFELYHFYYSYRQVIDIIKFLPDNIKEKLELDTSTLNQLAELTKYLEKVFDLDYMMNLNFTNYKEEEKSFFNEGIHKELDDLQKKINSSKDFMKNLVSVLEKLIDDKKYLKTNNKTTNLINLKYNERDGHYLILTTRRFKLLNKKLSKMKKLDVCGFKLKVSELDIRELPRSSNTKINCNKIKEISSNLVVHQTNLALKLQELFKKECNKISNKYSDAYNYWTKKIGLIDFLNSGAICAKKLGYCKPEIVESDNSFFDGENMRHPIVEVINQDVQYHPHSVKLGEDQKGILLYGINSSGKSTLMKSIGLNIILAQIGYYVSATNFRLSPYKSLFTRINGNDNIFRGLSSFMVEMVELMAILKRNTENTLVIGDEICRGTEEKSANILVAYMLEKLSKSNTSFITATHLHQIAEMPSVKNLSNVKPMHLKVEYDIENDVLIYSRDLQEGQGEKFYGVQVAKFVMKDDEFNKRTLELEHEYGEKVKTSHYNKNNWMVECYFCKTHNKLETHHINWQKDCEDNRVIEKPHINKNSNYNLLTVCQHCHDKIDRGELHVDGFVHTSNGKMLKYESKKKESKKKYDQDKVKNIFKYKDVGITLKQAKKKIKKELDIKISTSTIDKIWNNKY
jgi:DNA mismatch repair protein MutS